jgi:hypothetical protein
MYVHVCILCTVHTYGSKYIIFICTTYTILHNVLIIIYYVWYVSCYADADIQTLNLRTHTVCICMFTVLCIVYLCCVQCILNKICCIVITYRNGQTTLNFVKKKPGIIALLVKDGNADFFRACAKSTYIWPKDSITPHHVLKIM